jgi:hypothetical protein
MRGALILSVGLVATLGCDQNRTEPQRPKQSQSSTAPQEKLELHEAVRRGLVTVKARGAGLTQAVIELSLKGQSPLAVEVPATTFLGSKRTGVQNMVVTKSAVIDLPVGATSRPLTVSVACVNMPDAAPVDADELVVQPLPTRGTSGKWADLRKLLAAPAFQELDSVAQQFAVWTVTDDPASVEKFTLIAVNTGRPNAPFLGPQNRGPDRDTIKAVFTKAGIDPGRYVLFQPPRPPIEDWTRERILQTNRVSSSAKADAIERAAMEKRAPNASELAKIKPLDEAGAAVALAEERFAKASQSRQSVEARTYAEAKAKDGLEDRAWEAVERQTAQLRKEEAEARVDARTQYRRWLGLASAWVRTHWPKEEADRAVRMWEGIADTP